jgi:3-hydroxybutyryl-CoA dehydrogenase
MNKPTAPKRIAVIGGGLMGHGIAYAFGAAGYPTRIYEPNPEVRAAIPERLESIRRLLGAGATALEKISVHDDLAQAVTGADVVFEAAPEKLELKRQIFAELEALVSDDTILASNSSAIPAGQIGCNLRKKDRLVGAHFWNPPYLVPLVEVIQAEGTSEATVASLLNLLRGIGKTAVHVKRDIPGFIGNRLQHALKREAIALLADGVADAATIDTVVKEGFGARLAVLGPLEKSDLVGLDLTLDIHETLIPHLDRLAEPHPLLRQKVAEGKVGMRAGEGFRRWTAEEAEEVRERLRRYLAGLVAHK